MAARDRLDRADWNPGMLLSILRPSYQSALQVCIGKHEDCMTRSVADPSCSVTSKEFPRNDGVDFLVSLICGSRSQVAYPQGAAHGHGNVCGSLLFLTPWIASMIAHTDLQETCGANPGLCSRSSASVTRQAASADSSCRCTV